jgi:hypothetical protein
VSNRTFDVELAVVGLLFLAPLPLRVALLVKLDSPGPVFFRQERMGKRWSMRRGSATPPMAFRRRGAAMLPYAGGTGR